MGRSTHPDGGELLKNMDRGARFKIGNGAVMQVVANFRQHNQVVAKTHAPEGRQNALKAYARYLYLPKRDGDEEPSVYVANDVRDHTPVENVTAVLGPDDVAPPAEEVSA